jgi:hypothetical protein
MILKRTKRKVMSEHLCKRLFVQDRDVVEVESDTKAHVLLMDDCDYSNYKSGQSYQYYGGFFTHFPARLVPPRTGYQGLLFWRWKLL